MRYTSRRGLVHKITYSQYADQWRTNCGIKVEYQEAGRELVTCTRCAEAIRRHVQWLLDDIGEALPNAQTYQAERKV